MALEKLTISIDQGGTFSVPFNPGQITLDKSAAWDSPPVAGRNASEAQFRHGNPFTLAVDLFFDTYEEGTDVQAHTRQFADLLMRRSGRMQPPRCKLEWGSHKFDGYYWVLERLSQRFTLFLPDGTPVRATLGCSFRQSQSSLEEQEELDGRLQAGQVLTLQGGETFASLVYKLYRDPGLWQVIAWVNGIDNPLKVPLGTRLFFPALDAVLAFKKTLARLGKPWTGRRGIR